MTGEGLLSSSDEGTLSREAELAFECSETFFFFLREEKDGGIGGFDERGGRVRKESHTVTSRRVTPL